MSTKYGIAAVAVIAAVGPAAAQDLTTLKILTPVPRTASWYPVLVGEALGYFEDAGIALELIPGGDLPALSFIDNGTVDIASIDAPQVVQAQARGLDIDVVYEVMHGAVEGVYVPAGSAVQTMTDLAGSMIGIVGESDRSLLVTALDVVGVDPAGVQIVVMGESAPLLANSLSGGQVAAIVGGPSDLVSLRSQGLEIRNVLPEEIGDLPANSYVIRADRIEEMRPVLERFFEAWAKSVHAGEIDPETVAAIAAAAVPEDWINPELGTLLLDLGLSLHVPDNGIYGELRSDIWTNLQEDLLAAGEIETLYENAEFLNDAFIEAANGFDPAQVAADLEAWKADNM